MLLARPVVVEPGFLDLFVNDAPQFGVLFLPIHHMVIIDPATIVTRYKVMTVIHYIPEAPWDAPGTLFVALEIDPRVPENKRKIFITYSKTQFLLRSHDIYKRACPAR